MQAKTIVITGASDGIGAEAARLLHAAGAKVVIVGRNPAKTQAIANELGVPYYVADFSKLAAVQNLALQLRKSYPHIDVLINNAGGIFRARAITEDGHETTMQVNYLASFMLTSLLLDVLVKSHATIINTSSIVHKVLSNFNINDLETEHGYTPNVAYGNAKLENILFTKELHRRYHNKGINTAAFHPGLVMTHFASGSTSPLRFVYRTPLKYVFGFISAKRGADTLVWLASTMPGTDWQSGKYYYRRKQTNTAPQATDPQLAETLWNKSEALVAHFKTKPTT